MAEKIRMSYDEACAYVLEAIEEFLEETGSTFGSTSHTEVIVKLMAKNYKNL